MGTTRPFAPGVIDYDGRMSVNYPSGRALSADAAGTWCATLEPFLQHAIWPRIVDVGAGTGRFCALFARSFQAHVIGIEPAHGMLSAGAATIPANLAYVAGRAERLPLRDKSCDLAWLSQVWHHIEDRQSCARELHRILHPGGYVLLRGSFGDRLDGFPTMFHYWPQARDICRQLPTMEQTAAAFEASGFVCAEQRRVQQTTCASLRAFATRTRLRADTALALISDAEFWQGQSAIEAAAAREDMPTPVIETIDLLVLRCVDNTSDF